MSEQLQPHGYLIAYVRGMSKAIDTWPNTPSRSDIMHYLASQTLPGNVDATSYAKWFVQGWDEALQLMREADVDIYRWRFYDGQHGHV